MKNRLKPRTWPLLVAPWLSAAALGQANIYHPFPDSNAVWMGHHWPGLINCGEHYAYALTGDTLIGGQTYHTLVIPYVNAYGACTVYHTPGYAGALRQDIAAKKVYWVAPGNVAEELLYDFDPAVGDIIPGFDRLGCSQPEEVVTLMDSVLIGSTYRKQWHCGTFPNTNTLIEGIGFISGVLEGCATGMPDGPFNVLDCFSQDGLTLFSNGMDACDLQTLVPRSSPAVVRTIVYPDPFFDRAMVRFERQLAQATVLVLDPSGRAVRTVAPVSGEQLILQRDGLAPGCYSIVLVESGQRTGAARMVVQDR